MTPSSGIQERYIRGKKGKRQTGVKLKKNEGTGLFTTQNAERLHPTLEALLERRGEKCSGLRESIEEIITKRGAEIYGKKSS